jgi:hypothetical protein
LLGPETAVALDPDVEAPALVLQIRDQLQVVEASVGEQKRTALRRQQRTGLFQQWLVDALLPRKSG